MNEIHNVFETLEERASVSPVTALADRISVRDYVRSAEIGAYRSERGVNQRLRFNVVLEVAGHAAAQSDDVDQVVSYDTITQAIDHLLTAERLDLLETLAERIARQCLRDRRVLRAFVRVEKLDRIPGAFGVEIVRTRTGGETPRLQPVAPLAAGPGPSADVLFLGSDAQRHARAWLDEAAARESPVVLCVPPGRPCAPAASFNARRIGYLAVEQAALALADLDPRFEVVSSRAELDWALEQGRHPIWAPARMAEAAAEPGVPQASDPLALAAWLAALIGGRLLVADADEAAGAISGAAHLLPADDPSGLRGI